MQDEPNQPVTDEEVVLADPTQNPEPPVEDTTPEQVEPAEEAEETPAEASLEETPEASQEDSKQEAPEEQPLSRRAQTRFEKLEALRNAGRDKFQQFKQPAPSQPDALDYSQALDAAPEVIQQLQDDRQRAQQVSYDEGLKRAEFIEFKTNIRLDLPLIQDKMSKLDPIDAKKLDDDYLEYVGFDGTTQTVKHPDIGYADYIEARIEQGQRLAASMSAETAKNVAKQAAATGLRPDGSSAKRLNLNKAPQDMTMEELYASIGQTPPKKS